MCRLEQEQSQQEQQQSVPQESLKKSERYWLSLNFKTIFYRSCCGTSTRFFYIVITTFFSLIATFVSFTGQSQWLSIKAYEKNKALEVKLMKVNVNTHTGVFLMLTTRWLCDFKDRQFLGVASQANL